MLQKLLSHVITWKQKRAWPYVHLSFGFSFKGLLNKTSFKTF